MIKYGLKKKSRVANSFLEAHVEIRDKKLLRERLEMAKLMK
jgi:hypothetical protein